MSEFLINNKTFVSVLTITPEGKVYVYGNLVSGAFPNVYKNFIHSENLSNIVISRPVETENKDIVFHIGTKILKIDETGLLFIDEVLVDDVEFCRFLANKENWK